MSLTAQEYADLSDDAYRDRRNLVGLKKTVPIGGQTYRVIAAESASSGFQAAAYRQTKPPFGIVIAYRGTEGLGSVAGWHDFATDAVMVADKVNPQEPAARAFTQEVIDYAKAHGVPLSDITVTGHSLGGTLAEIEAWRFGLHGDTFNAYGAAGLGYGVPAGGTSVTDYVEAVDVVSAASPQYGRVIPLATQQDIDLLQQHSFFGEHVHDLDVAKERGIAAHGIANFLPGADGQSILSTGDIELAATHAKLIGSYRHNIQSTRGDIHLASEIPDTGVWGIARLAEGMQVGISAVEYFGGKDIEALEVEGKAADQAATFVAGATQRGVAELQQRIDVVERHVGEAVHEVATHLPGFDHPDHPQHALYAALKERLPTGTSEARLAQVTAACRQAKLNKPEDLGPIYITDKQAFVTNNSILGSMPRIDLTRPPPSIENSLQQVEQFNQQPQGVANPSQQQAPRHAH